jgi:phospholipase C
MMVQGVINLVGRDGRTKVPMRELLNTAIQSLNIFTRFVAAALLIAGAGAAYGADTYNAGQLSIPSLGIGGATYSNVVVTVGSIVSGPVGTSPYGIVDTYNPANGQLNVQSVTVGSATYYNVVITVAGLVSIGGVAGADTYNGTDLMISYVEVLGGSLYTNVVVTGSRVISVAGGMPTLAVDNYDAQSGGLAIAAVVDQVNGKIYTNVVVAAGTIESMGPPGYVLTATALNPPLVTAGKMSTSTVVVIPANGYTGTVTLSCGMASGGMPVPSCSVNPPAVTISSIHPQTTALTVLTSVDAPGGTYNFSVNASDANKLAPANGPQTLKLTTLALIQHVVIIFQENRTPDNLFHDPVLIARGADIASSGKNSLGQTIPLSSIDLGTAGSNPLNYDLSHAHSAFVAMYDGGKMDGADLVQCRPAAQCPPNAHPNPQFRYVIASDVAPYFAMAEQYTFGDRMFQTNQGPSFPAHQFIISGTSAPTATSPLFAAENPILPPVKPAAGCIAPRGNTVVMIDASGSESKPAPQYPCFEHPTVTDLLDTQGLTWRYYAPSPGSIWTAPDAIEHICQQKIINATLTCVGPIWTNSVSIPQTNVLTDIANGQLAQVSWVIPDGLNSDHAVATDGTGPSWVASIVNAIGNSAYWANTAIFITWDDWGGWFDHVAPKVIDDGVSWGSGYVYGFRVPLVVVSPYAKAAYISHNTHDFGSILKYIETNFNLPSLGYADTPADDMADCFDYTQLPLAFKPIPAAHPAAYFLNNKHPPTPPDDD